MSVSTPIPADVLACPDDSFALVVYTKLVGSHFAAYMAARYNGPVYLVGSSLRAGVPRDIDIRVIVADDEFRGRYYIKFEPENDNWLRAWPNQRWIDDMAKRNGELARDFRFNADFQVYPARHAQGYDDQPRVVLAKPSGPRPEELVRLADERLSEAIVAAHRAENDD